TTVSPLGDWSKPLSSRRPDITFPARVSSSAVVFSVTSSSAWFTVGGGGFSWFSGQ
ncbi:hypothetical protein A2U01_0060569, partial [Trifolium medium]|nr:hypothetical protein [Trifolium medium]